MLEREDGALRFLCSPKALELRDEPPVLRLDVAVDGVVDRAHRGVLAHRQVRHSIHVDFRLVRDQVLPCRAEI
jgi:hypothetical protein